MEVDTQVDGSARVKMVAENDSDRIILEKLQKSLSLVTHTDLSPDKSRLYFKLHEERRVDAT